MCIRDRSSSEQSTARLKSHGIEVMELNHTGTLPLYVDGADECDPHTVSYTHLDVYKRQRADEGTAHSAEITVLTRQGDVPTIHEQDLAQVMQLLRSHLQGDTPLFMSEHRMDMSGNGSWTWVRARGRVVERDAEGRPVRIAGTARDVTASHNAEYEHRIASEVMRLSLIHI